MSGFSVTQGASSRAIRRRARPCRSRSEESCTSTNTWKLSNDLPGSISWAGPRLGPTVSRQGIWLR